jgi:hypothetical protein
MPHAAIMGKVPLERHLPHRSFCPGPRLIRDRFLDLDLSGLDVAAAILLGAIPERQLTLASVVPIFSCSWVMSARAIFSI